MSIQAFIITLTSIISGTLVVCLPVFMVFWMISKRRDRRMLNSQEDRILRETFEGLSKMEERISNLETILLDSERKQRERL